MTKLSDIMQNIPIDTELKVSNQVAFIHIIHELGFRENKMWPPDDDVMNTDHQLLKKLIMFSDGHTKDQLKKIEAYAQSQVNEAVDNAILGLQFRSDIHPSISGIIIEELKKLKR